MIQKSFKDISWNVTEDVYRADPAISYSTLSKFNREGFANLEHLFDRTTSPSLLFGSIVDSIITGGMQEFNDRFFVANFTEMSDSITSIVKDLYAKHGESYSELCNIPKDYILCSINNFQYQTRWKDETRINDVVNKGSKYYELLSLAGNKEIISDALYNDAMSCVEALKNSPSTKFFFQTDNPFESIERLYQLKFKGDYKGIAIRSMADLIIVDHKAKTVQPVDLKTSFKPEYKFYLSFIEWNYFIQAQLYWYLIRQTMDKDPYFKDFNLLDYKFIVICNKTRNPLVWDFDKTTEEKDIVIGKTALPNWRSILETLNYYLIRQPKVPIGIKEGENQSNNITEWLEHENNNK